MISDKAKDKLLKAHGLNPEKHTDSDVDDVIENSVSPDDMEEMENRAIAAETALAEKEIEGDLAKYANRIGKKPEVIEHWKSALIANRDAAIAMLEEIPELGTTTGKDKPQPLHVANRAGQPKPIEQTANEKDAAADTKKAKSIANRAREISDKEKIPYRKAFDRAQQELA